MTSTRVLGGRVSLAIYKRVLDICKAENKGRGDVVREAIESYVENYDKLKTTKGTISEKEPSVGVTTVEKVDETPGAAVCPDAVTFEKVSYTPGAAVCPLCDAPLDYVKGWFTDKIVCSNSECDTHKGESLRDWMGEKAYRRLLNLRRREFREKAKKEKADEEDEFDELFG